MHQVCHIGSFFLYRPIIFITLMKVDKSFYIALYIQSPWSRTSPNINKP
uniref:Uncharacterized protein n=1 Tax=Rhizophora mucronata TaxID=61149 RepID=A0A2P2P8T6_RHIMU